MVATYRRPGVYLTESLLLNPSDVANTTTVAAFVGMTPKGPPNTPVLVDSWSAYVNTFGGFSTISYMNTATPPVAMKALSYMPFALYTFFQNGGRFAWVVRSISSATGKKGVVATVPVSGTGTITGTAFNINAASVGEWGNKIAYRLDEQTTDDRGTVGPDAADVSIFTLRVLQQNANGDLEVVESFPNVTTTGDVPGTKRVDFAVNDLSLGSRLIRIANVDPTQVQPGETTNPVYLTGGVDPGIPDSAEMQSAALALAPIEGPIVLNIVGYLNDASKVDTDGAFEAYVGASIDPKTQFPEREDILMICDYCGPREPSDTTSNYISNMKGTLLSGSDSYTASYGPWVIIPHPAQAGSLAQVPPAGAVMGIMARIDASIGVFRAPAGTIANIQNAVATAIKFSDTELGDLNNSNINIIRPVVGSGVCVMGARTRKGYGPDRYVSGRRTLIDIKESLRRSTQWAVFENNDERLWSSLRMTADQILRPMWERGGLRGATAQQAYYIRCDATLNTLSVIASGEVRMEIGVALEYPAEFVLIRITQINAAQSTNEFPQIV